MLSNFSMGEQTGPLEKEKTYEQFVEYCIQVEMETLYPEEFELENLKKELESANKTIEELKIEENIFNGISIELYAKQREVDNLTWLLMDSEKIISEILKSNEENRSKLEKLLQEIKIYANK
jgi:ribosomal silencing factor RsfS